MLDAEGVIALLQLKPLAFEGGYYQQTYKSDFGTAIYYFLTSVPQSFSVLHTLPYDELWHFYAGDAIALLMLHPNGNGETHVLGNKLEEGQRPQITVPAGVWQGARIVPGGKWALMGTTMAPAFNPDGFIRGRRKELLSKYPKFNEKILDLTWEEDDATA